MDMPTIINQMATLFLVLAVGYAANKVKVLSDGGDKLLSKLVLTVTMPCTILVPVLGGEIELSASDTLYFLLMIIIIYALAFIVAFPAARLLAKNAADRGLYSYMIVFANVGFMGFPVTQSIFGEVSAFYVSVFHIPFSLLGFSLGILMLSGEAAKINFKLFLNPPLIASFVSIIIYITGFTLPVSITGAVKLIGGMTTPAAMLIIGSTLANIPLREVLTDWRLYPLTFIKLIFMPIVTWLILKNFISGDLMLGILTVLSGMPAATSATLLTMEYGGNERLAAKGIFLTTLLSVFTIPLLVYLLLT